MAILVLCTPEYSLPSSLVLFVKKIMFPSGDLMQHLNFAFSHSSKAQVSQFHKETYRG